MHGLELMVQGIFSLFTLIVLGWLLHDKLSWMINNPDTDFWNRLSVLVYMIGIPCLSIDLYADCQWQWRYLWFILAAVMTQTIMVTIARFFYVMGRPSKTSATIASAMVNMNAVFLGLPLVVATIGNEGGVLSMLFSAILTPLAFGPTIWFLHNVNHDHLEGRAVARMVGRALLKDPIVIGMTMGVIISVFRIGIPAAVLQPIHWLGAMATPLALLTIGARLRLHNIWKTIGDLSVISVIKLMIAPGVALIVSRLVLTNANERLILVILNAMPTATSTMLIVEKHGGDAELAANAISMTTLLAPMTLTIISMLFLFH